MSKFDKNYSNEEITVFWKPDTCIHSRICFSNLMKVFDPRKKPWIDLSKGNTEEIIEAVKKCPSGALSYSYKDKAVVEANTEDASDKTSIKLHNNGPLEIEGECVITDKDGNEIVQNGKFFLCRCGSSANKPFCDGTHRKINFIA